MQLHRKANLASMLIGREERHSSLPRHLVNAGLVGEQDDLKPTLRPSLPDVNLVDGRPRELKREEVAFLGDEQLAQAWPESCAPHRHAEADHEDCNRRHNPAPIERDKRSDNAWKHEREQEPLDPDPDLVEHPRDTRTGDGNTFVVDSYADTAREPRAHTIRPGVKHPRTFGNRRPGKT